MKYRWKTGLLFGLLFMLTGCCTAQTGAAADITAARTAAGGAASATESAGETNMETETEADAETDVNADAEKESAAGTEEPADPAQDPEAGAEAQSLPALQFESEDWGLGFGEPGAQPAGNASAADLKAYHAYYVGDDTEPVIYLTFDCGYENGNTEAILDALEKHDVQATFLSSVIFWNRRPIW